MSPETFLVACAITGSFIMMPLTGLNLITQHTPRFGTVSGGFKKPIRFSDVRPPHDVSLLDVITNGVEFDVCMLCQCRMLLIARYSNFGLDILAIPVDGASRKFEF